MEAVCRFAALPALLLLGLAGCHGSAYRETESPRLLALGASFRENAWRSAIDRAERIRISRYGETHCVRLVVDPAVAQLVKQALVRERRCLPRSKGCLFADLTFESREGSARFTVFREPQWIRTESNEYYWITDEEWRALESMDEGALDRTN